MDIFLPFVRYHAKYIFAFLRISAIASCTLCLVMPCSAAYADWLFPSMRHSRKIERWLSVSVLQNASVSSAASTPDLHSLFVRILSKDGHSRLNDICKNSRFEKKIYPTKFNSTYIKNSTADDNSNNSGSG